MTRHLLLTALLLTLALPARAEEAVLATLSAHSGSLPPPYAWSLEVTVTWDGSVTVTRCAGYETEGPACKTGTGAAVTGTVEAILLAAKASQLLERPASAIEPPLVGGGWTTGTVALEGGTIELIAQPVEDDEPRVNAVLGAIFGAVPDDLLPIVEGE
ncbi:MAG: hypothetical protein MUE52_04695 [Tabrizicola sp.]|jgi:hypothetical protein|nr:hypothetical protein [Tabrizicola sp.]